MWAVQESWAPSPSVWEARSWIGRNADNSLCKRILMWYLGVMRNSGTTFHMLYTLAGTSGYKTASPRTIGIMEVDMEPPDHTKMVRINGVAYVSSLSPLKSAEQRRSRLSKGRKHFYTACTTNSNPSKIYVPFLFSGPLASVLHL